MSEADKIWLDFKIAMQNKAAVERLEKRLYTDRWQIARKNGGKL